MKKLKTKNGDTQKKRSGREVRGVSPEAGRWTGVGKIWGGSERVKGDQGGGRQGTVVLASWPSPHGTCGNIADPVTLSGCWGSRGHPDSDEILDSPRQKVLSSPLSATTTVRTGTTSLTATSLLWLLLLLLLLRRRRRRRRPPPPPPLL